MDELIERVRATRQEAALGELFDPWTDIEMILGSVELH
jgi:hypothetical protein